MSEAPGRTIIRQGKTYLFFSGYSYLGMSHVAGFRNLLKEGIDRYGALFPSSRISNTTLPLYGHLEHYLSQLTGQDSTVSYASGTLACQAIGQLLSDGENIFVAPGTHPAMGLGNKRDGAPMEAVDGGSYEDWSRKLIRFTADSTHDHFALVANSVNPLTGVINDFMFLQDLPRQKRFTFLIDDSHGIGWMGEHGEGIASALMHLPHVEYLIVYSLSKAFHIQGGAVSCPPAWAERLRRAPQYTASTPMAPAFAHTLLNAGSLYEVQRALLEGNVDSLTRMVNAMPETDGALSALQPTQTPVFLCGATQANAFSIAPALEEQGIIISSFAYPDPAGPPLNRVVLSALHEPSDLAALARGIRKVQGSAGPNI